jgi:tRNA A-37 threonylcarbamoyl transferase component Bud32
MPSPIPTPAAARRTVRLAAPAPAPAAADDTDFVLSASLADLPKPPPAGPMSWAAGLSVSGRPPAARGTLDPDARALFLQRLRLCCLIAAVPFGFLSLCAATNFVAVVGLDVVGWPGLALSAGTLGGLVALAGVLARLRRRVPGETALRALEIGVFGVMGVCVAYWQFVVLTNNLGPQLLTAALDLPVSMRAEAVASPVTAGASVASAAAVAAARKDPEAPLPETLPLPPPLALAARDKNTDTRLEQSNVLAATLLMHFLWFALIVFHGVLVPNTLARGAGVAVGMCVLAGAISVVAALVVPEVPWRHLVVVFAVAGTMLSAAAGLSVFGAAKTEALREQVREAQAAVREMGQYRLRKKLGHGGMGEVYLAEHSLMKRPCALKRIHAKFLDNPEQVRRFEREVRATSQLRHPNTVTIYDYGRADDGTFYYAMEYVPGMSLEEIVGRHGPMPPERVVHVLRQTVGALREAHGQGLVHRDIKPSNILVCPAGIPHDQAKLVDFGLVHTPGLDDEDLRKITREGLIVGTPEYMSPEQASGGALDGRSDLFSLGSVAYYVLTGKEGFNRGNPVPTLMAVVGEEPTPIASLVGPVPADVLRVVAKCLAKRPADRYQSAAELEADLSGCECYGDWTADRAAAWWAAHQDGLPPDTGHEMPALAEGAA